MLFVFDREKQENDDRLFEQLYYKYRRLMMSVAYRVLHNYHDAEEAVADAFFAISKRFDFVKTLDDDAQRNYCCQAAKNKALVIYRKTKRVSDNERSMTDADLQTLNAGDFNEEWENKQFACAIQDLLSSIPQIYVDTLYMFYNLGMTEKEIAKECGVSKKTIEKRMRKLRSFFAALKEEDV